MGQCVPIYARVINVSLISVERYRNLQHLIPIFEFSIACTNQNGIQLVLVAKQLLCPPLAITASHIDVSIIRNRSVDRWRTAKPADIAHESIFDSIPFMVAIHSAQSQKKKITRLWSIELLLI